MKYNKFDKNASNENTKKEARSYSYYSRVLEKPFDSIEELENEEAKYYAAQRAKEDKAAQKKADAKKVEDAFKALNQARRDYKEDLTILTEQYSKDLVDLKERFETIRKEIQSNLATAEEAYQAALKNFTEKYDQYHMTLKDGDFETTISSQTTREASSTDFSKLANIFDLFFKF